MIEGTVFQHEHDKVLNLLKPHDALLWPIVEGPALSREIVTPFRQEKHDNTPVIPDNDTMRDAQPGRDGPLEATSESRVLGTRATTAHPLALSHFPLFFHKLFPY